MLRGEACVTCACFCSASHADIDAGSWVYNYNLNQLHKAGLSNANKRSDVNE